MGSAPTIAEGGGGRRLAGLSEFRLRFGRSAKGGLSVAARLTAWSPGPRLVAGSRRAVRSVHSVGMSGAAVRWLGVRLVAEGYAGSRRCDSRRWSNTIAPAAVRSSQRSGQRRGHARSHYPDGILASRSPFRQGFVRLGVPALLGRSRPCLVVGSAVRRGSTWPRLRHRWNAMLPSSNSSITSARIWPASTCDL